MSRTIEDVAVVNEMPPVGTHRCKCAAVVPGQSKNKGTPQLTLTWAWAGGTFQDDAYITPKTINRLAVIAQHICAFPKAHPLPDDDMECANYLATYIEQNIVGRSAMVTVAEETNSDPTKPPRRKVTFGGYAPVADAAPATPKAGQHPKPDDLPC